MTSVDLEVCRIDPFANGTSSPTSAVTYFHDPVNADAEMLKIFERIGLDWGLNAFQIRERYGSDIRVVAEFLYKRYNFESSLKLPSDMTQTFYRELESNYKKVPFHNSTHATDVLINLIYVLHNSPIN
jgi:hypothetical protein